MVLTVWSSQYGPDSMVLKVWSSQYSSHQYGAHSMVLKPREVITTEYCRAPEVFLGVSVLSSAIDLWAVGIAGIALLCGSTIFWRPRDYEPDVPGFEPRSKDYRDWPSIFVNQKLVLGPMSESEWPGCERLPAWSKLASFMARAPLYERLGRALSDPGLVRRPLAADGAGARLLEDWIRWEPAARLAAQESLGAAFFSECAVGPPAVVERAVMSCSHTVGHNGVGVVVEWNFCASGYSRPRDACDACANC